MHERERTGDRKRIRETDSDHSAFGGRLTDFPRPVEPAARRALLARVDVPMT